MLDLLDRSNVAVEQALLVLYARQTADEQQAGATTEHNGQGFGHVDAELLTSYAQQVERWRFRAREGQRLTERQMQFARPKVKKYVGQLVEVANQRLGVETPPEPRRRRSDRGNETETDQ
jgi:hypothetical protein